MSYKWYEVSGEGYKIAMLTKPWLSLIESSFFIFLWFTFCRRRSWHEFSSFISYVVFHSNKWVLMISHALIGTSFWSNWIFLKARLVNQFSLKNCWLANFFQFCHTFVKPLFQPRELENPSSMEYCETEGRCQMCLSFTIEFHSFRLNFHHGIHINEPYAQTLAS